MLVAFTAADHVPPGQSAGAAEPTGQKEPRGQKVHVAFDAAPAAADHEPAAHGVASSDAKGQKEPAGQITGAPEAQ